MTVKSVLRPQPIGLFDGPAGLLLVSESEGAASVLDGLALGRLPAEWPSSAGALEAAIRDDVDGAVGSLGEDLESVINRLVLQPSAEHLEAARIATERDLELRTLVDAAAYASGLSDEPPVADGVDGEFAVLALTVRAARALEFKDSRGALRTLREAVPFAAAVGPALHARVLAMLAEHQQQHGGGERSLDIYDEAIALLQHTDLDEFRAGLHLQRGLVAHQLADVQRHRLMEAIRSYQSALIVLSEDRHPEQFALANMNIAIAMLSMPMSQASDQVRLGVAVQSLRAALRVYRPETHPYEWSSSQMNLANALQYLPSKHRQDNLEEAVDLYEEVLGFRSPLSDPLGYARVLANQANALAHLAIFDHARTKYEEARTLFVAQGDHEAAEVIERQLQQVEEYGSVTE